MQCPGQDTRFWQPDDVFEVPCQACGAPVEFFKTDGFRRCPGCRKRIQNPKISLGCARWCAYAKECLGYDPKDLALADNAEMALIDRLVAAVREVFADDDERIKHSLLVLDRAQDIMRHEGGDPRVIMAAALLHDVGIPNAERKHGSSEPQFQEVEGAVVARQILEQIGMDEPTIEHVSRIVRSHHSADDIDTTEFRIVWDADRLEETPPGLSRQDEDRLGDLIDRVFRMEAGKRQAHRLLLK